nr:reverse transcriptase domain-containing protein [Tanacetum cinerariifolium]
HQVPFSSQWPVYAECHQGLQYEVGHLARDCRSSGNISVANTQRDNREIPKGNGYSYDVELADGKIVGIDTIIRGCTLNFLNHPFNMDLMSIELGSFDIIIGMDWLRRLTLKVKGNDVPTYTKWFQELTLICTKFVANETEKIDKYISGLPDNIFGSVKSSNPKTLDETIELGNDFMD